MKQTNIYILLKLIAFLSIFNTLACSNRNDVNNINQEYQFNSINIIKNNSNGVISWQLDSPEAIFDEDKRMIRAKSPLIIIYSQKKPKYDITSNSLTSFNNLESILLEGNVRLNQLNQQNIMLMGEILRWDINKDQMVIEQNPIVYSDNASVKAESIIFNIKSQDILFKGKTKSMIISDESNRINTEKLVVHSTDTKWNINTGELSSDNKIWGERLGKDTNNKYSFVGNSINANTKSKVLNLYGCTISRDKSAETISDKCQLDLFVNQENIPLIEPIVKNKKPLPFINKKNERIQFISKEDQVKTILKIPNIKSKMELID